MKHLLLSLTLTACSVLAAEYPVATPANIQVAVFNPLLGVRTYPTLDVAQSAAPIDARYACSLPGAIPQCSALIDRMTYGVMVAIAPAKDGQTRAFEVNVDYVSDGQQTGTREFVPTAPNGTASRIFWIGPVKVTGTKVIALKATE